MRHGQYAAGCLYAFVAYYHCAVVKRAVFEEYVFNQSLAYVGVYYFSRVYDVAQAYVSLENDERAYTLLAHRHACHYYRHYVLS